MQSLTQSSHLPHNLPGAINNSILDQINQSMLNNLSFQSLQTPLNLNQVQNFQNLNQTMPSSASAMTKQIPLDISQIHSQQKQTPLSQYHPVTECSNQSQVKSIQSQITKQQAQPQQLSTSNMPFKINPSITTTSTPQTNQLAFKPAQQSAIQTQIEKPKIPFYEFSPNKLSEPAKPIFMSTSFISTSQPSSNIFSAINLSKPTEANMHKPFSNLASSENIFKLTPANVSDTKSSLIAKPSIEPEEGETTENPEEYEPQVEFKPIVKLNEVEVKTGEEDEELLFKQRCRLFRFEKSTNEWKEKGIGDLKLLKHKETNVIRVLMRRDQVLKMCANHRINSEMKLNEISAKQFSWIAIDFSENEAKTEILLAKFRTPEEASQFKTEFEKAIKEMKILNVSKTPVKTLDKKNLVSEKPSLAEAFKTDNWNCNKCYVSNKKEDLKCICCLAKKVDLEADRDSGESKPITHPNGNQFSLSLKPNQQETKSSFKSDSSTFKSTLFEKESLPSFESVAESASIFPKKESGSSQKSIFKPLGFTGGFSTLQNQNSSLLGTKPLPLFATQSIKVEEGQEEEGENNNPEEYEPQIDFKPLVKLNEVEVKTGEEDEEILFKQRCKLYRYDTNLKEWKEKGTGEIKILKHKTRENFFRILMRRDQVLKLCANHRITNDLKWEIFNEKQVRWYAQDYSEGEGKNELLAVRFKNEDDTKKFKLICEESQRNADIECSNIKADINVDKAKIKCEDLKPSLSSLFKKTGWTCKQCYVVNENDLDKCKACQNEKFKIDKSEVEAVSNENKYSESNFFFGHAEKNNKSTISFDKSFGQISNTEKKEEKKIEKIFESKFGSSFSDLAKTGNLINVFNGGFTGGFSTLQNQNSSLLGTKPLPLFATQSIKVEEGQEEEGENNNPEEYEPQIDFKPLVKLNEVEVKTGEEDEEILFKQRCKLYRYDTNLKEWKEKGTGEIKILKHKTRENFFRILMRRDQVLKLCANHRITLEIKPELFNEKQVRWLANDCSEGTSQTEYFAAKFRSMEDAKNFLQELENLQKLIKTTTLFHNEKNSNCSRIFQKKEKDDINEIKIVYEAKATIEQVNKARSFCLPDTFYLYEKKTGCTGCIGCENEK